MIIMPIEHLQERWHFHQRMNKKVANNLDRLRAITSQSKSKQEILDAMHPWRLSISLRYNNTLTYLLMATSIGLIVFATFYLYQSGFWLMSAWVVGIILGCYAYFSLEKQSEVNQVIHQLTGMVFQYQYNVRFAQFPVIQEQSQRLNPTYMLMKIKQGFDCLKQGNSANELVDFAATTWQVDGHDYPVLLFQYLAINEVVMRDQKGNQYRKQVESHRWGACVFHMPALAFTITTTRSSFPRYPVTWTSSDIQFNQRFKIAGQQEFELAKNLTPQRILTLAHHLEQMNGTLMFHDDMQIFCYLSTQNIFQPQKPNKDITDISQLRGYLRTLHAPHYEQMQNSLMGIIRSFHDESLLKSQKTKAI